MKQQGNGSSQAAAGTKVIAQISDGAQAYVRVLYWICTGKYHQARKPDNRFQRKRCDKSFYLLYVHVYGASALTVIGYGD